MKLSRADLAFAVSRKLTGGTTVAATMIAAHSPAFRSSLPEASAASTRVRKKVSTSPPTSTNWRARPSSWFRLAPRRSSTSKRRWKCWRRVACRWSAMAPARMPAFWSRRSPYPAPLRLDRPDAIADFFRTRRALGIAGGMLVANPVPQAHEIPAEEMRAYIEAAQRPRRKRRRVRQGGNPLSARQDPGTDWRPQPGDQHRAGRKQCPARRAHRKGNLKPAPTRGPPAGCLFRPVDLDRVPAVR